MNTRRKFILCAASAAFGVSQRSHGVDLVSGFYDAFSFLSKDEIASVVGGRGVLDLAASINSAIAKISDQGGGVLSFGPYKFYLSQVVLRSGVVLQGAGVASSELCQFGGVNKDFVVSQGFFSFSSRNLARSELATVPRRFGLRDIRICGNKKENSRGRGVVFYGNAISLRRVLVYECAGDGIHTQFSPLAGSGSWAGQEEGDFDSVVSRDNGGRGWAFWGPHNSRIGSFVGCYNGDYGFASLPFDKSGGSGDGGVDYIAHIHTYANKDDKGIFLGAVCRVGAAITDGDNLDISANDVQISSYRGYNICGVREGLRISGRRVQIGTVNLKVYSKTTNPMALRVQGSGVSLGSVVLVSSNFDAKISVSGAGNVIERLWVDGLGSNSAEIFLAGSGNGIRISVPEGRVRVVFDARAIGNRADVVHKLDPSLRNGDECVVQDPASGNVCTFGRL